MKKIYFGILVLVLICSTTINMFAVSNFLPGTEPVPEDTSEGFFDFKSFKEWLNPQEELSDPEDALKRLNNMGHIGFTQVRSFLLKGNTNFFYIDVAAIAKTLNKIFLPLGYIVLLVSWSLHIATKTVTLELFEVKGIIEAFGRLMLGVITMGLSGKILDLISQISTSVSRGIVTTGAIDLVGMMPPQNTFDKILSNVPIVGEIYRLIKFGSLNLDLFLLNIALIIVAWLMLISLGIRLIKIAILQGTAPVFFALAAGEETKGYFQNFIMQYILICFKLVFMSVIFNAFQISFMKWANSEWRVTGNMGTGIVIMIIFCIMLLKSEDLFEKILHR